MDIPNDRTFEILEGRKNYLVNKMRDNDKNDYIKAEVYALDKIINFSKYILNNFPDELIKEIIGKNELKNKTVEETEDDNEYKVIYSYERNLSKDFKMDISFIQHKENEEILLVYKKYKRKMFKWAYQGKIRITRAILEEIFNKYNEITTEG
jgi:hypothetical protein